MTDLDLLTKDWRVVPFVVLDVETTGLDIEGTDRFVTGADRVVEIAAARFVEGVCAGTSTFSTLVNPGRPIPEEARAIHGIGDADVADAPSFVEAWPRVVPLLEGAAVASYNAPFDRPALRAEVIRTLGADWRGPPMLRARWIDPLMWVRVIDRYVKGSGRHKLGAVCARRGVITQDQHRARADAQAAGALFVVLRREIEGYIAKRWKVSPRDRLPLDRFLQMQAQIEREDAERFEEWKRKKPLPEGKGET